MSSPCPRERADQGQMMAGHLLGTQCHMCSLITGAGSSRVLMLISEVPRLFGKIFFFFKKKAQHRCQHCCKEAGSHGRGGGQTNCQTTSGSLLAASPTVTEVCMLSTAQHLWEGYMRGAKGASATNQEGATWTSNCRDRGTGTWPFRRSH